MPAKGAVLSTAQGKEWDVAVVGGGIVGLATARALALRAHVAARPLETSAGPIPLTISIGWSFKAPEDTADDLVRRADHGLYAAKSSGRNRVAAGD